MGYIDAPSGHPWCFAVAVAPPRPTSSDLLARKRPSTCEEYGYETGIVTRRSALPDSRKRGGRRSGAIVEGGALTAIPGAKQGTEAGGCGAPGPGPLGSRGVNAL